MTQKILLVTVGGAPKPIITSIKTLQPDRVIFFCSTGSKGSESQIIGAGKPCKIQRNENIIPIPNIPIYVKLGDRFQMERDIVKIQNPDDATECYRLATEIIRELLLQGHDISADYTGGTKTMALALGMAAMDYDIKLYVTTKLGRNLQQPVSEGERTLFVSTAFIDIQRKLEQFLPIFLQQYNYSAAIIELNKLIRSIPFFSEMSSKKVKKVHQIAELCEAFEAWDRFDHSSALNRLKSFLHNPDIRPLGDFLKRVMHSRADIDEQFTIIKTSIPYHGYEIVEDLLLNAERRAKQKRYDDAVGRLYRALELLMQIQFKKAYQMTTFDIQPDRLLELSESVKEKCENTRSPISGRITLGLRKGYELLREIPGEPLGDLYRTRARRISEVIDTRNLSLFAHGFRPTQEEDYEDFEQVVGQFIKQAIERLRPSNSSWKAIQFPDVLNLP